MSREYDYLFKIVLRGSQRVGKNSILNNLADIPNDKSFNLSRRDFSIKLFKLDQISVKVQVWNSSLFERFRSIFQKVIRTTNFVIFIFDLTNRESFEDITYYVNELQDINVGKILVGNKCDLEACISRDEILFRALELGLTYLEISVKSKLNLDLLFEIICRDYINRIR